MPLYLYECEKCEHQDERWMTISEMEEFEQKPQKHIMCDAVFRRVLKPRRHVTFHADVYENIGPEPVRIENAQQLQDECRKHDVSSNYMADMSSLFRAKKNLWV